MFEFSFVGVAAGSNAAPISFSGSFDKTAAPSTITSDTRTATVPAGNVGYIDVTNFNVTGSLFAQEYQQNGGSWTVMPEGTAILLANGDTLAFRITGAASGESLAFDVRDFSSNTLIETVNLVSS